MKRQIWVIYCLRESKLYGKYLQSFASHARVVATSDEQAYEETIQKFCNTCGIAAI